jgi:hypothetical protein
MIAIAYIVIIILFSCNYVLIICIINDLDNILVKLCGKLVKHADKYHLTQGKHEIK